MEKDTAMKSRKQLEEALKAKDKMRVRAIVMEALEYHAGKREALEVVAFALDSDVELFEPEDGRLRRLPREQWGPEYEREVREGLKENFSFPALQTYADIVTEMAANPEMGASPQEEEASDSGRAIRKPNPLKVVGYIIMLLGVAAAIVAVCIPLRFLIGLGIGVFMLGSVVTYLAIK